MLERMILAAIITCCIYLFLNLGGKSSNAPSFDSKNVTFPALLHRVAFFNL